MALRAVLVGLIVAATAAFVVGAVIERSESGHHDQAPAATSASGEVEASGEEGEHAEGAESADEHGEESAVEGSPAATAEEPHAELRPLGIDVEAWPFVTLAAIVSLALAAAAWMRSRAVAVLALVAVAMLLFAALDVREVVHQLDVDERGLAVIAGAVAALHGAAALIAVAMMTRAARRQPGRHGDAGTMAA